MDTPHSHASNPSPSDHAHPAATFTIRLRFSGLCLFVPEPAGGINTGGELAAMHVLLINAGDDTPMHGWTRPTPHKDDHARHGGHAASRGSHPKHYSMLYVDEAHLAPGRELRGRQVGIPLKDTRLTLPGPGGGTWHPGALSASVIPLHEVSEVVGLPREWIGERPGRQVAAQIVLTAGSPGEHPATARVRVLQPGENPGDLGAGEPWICPIASEVAWVIPDVAGSKLTLTLRDIDTRKHKVRECELYPVGGELRLDVSCLPLYELPGAAPSREPEPGEPVEHFGAFFDVFPGVPRPTLWLTTLERTASTSVCTTAQVQLLSG